MPSPFPFTSHQSHSHTHLPHIPHTPHAAEPGTSMRLAFLTSSSDPATAAATAAGNHRPPERPHTALAAGTPSSTSPPTLALADITLPPLPSFESISLSVSPPRRAVSLPVSPWDREGGDGYSGSNGKMSGAENKMNGHGHGHGYGNGNGNGHNGYGYHKRDEPPHRLDKSIAFPPAPHFSASTISASPFEPSTPRSAASWTSTIPDMSEPEATPVRTKKVSTVSVGVDYRSYSQFINFEEGFSVIAEDESDSTGAGPRSLPAEMEHKPLPATPSMAAHVPQSPTRKPPPPLDPADLYEAHPCGHNHPQLQPPNDTPPLSVPISAPAPLSPSPSPRSGREKIAQKNYRYTRQAPPRITVPCRDDVGRYVHGNESTFSL